MTLGTKDRRKLGLLVGLGLVAAYMVYANLLSGPSAAPAVRPAAAPAEPAGASPAGAGYAPGPAEPRRSVPVRSRSDEFHPVLRSKRPEDRIDPMSVDPTLRLDLLAKLQDQEPAGGTRNLFQFGAQPVPKAALPKGPEPKVLPKPALPQAAANAPGAKPPEPPPVPPPFKYYGFSTERDNGKRRAFFLNGEDIVVASEGDLLNKRYRVVRIGPTSAVLEDTQSKRQQPLPLVEEAGG
jgi:hypothetical protein